MTDAPPAPPRGGSIGGFLRNTLWLLAGRGTGAVLGLVYLGLATRGLGPEGFGRFVLILGMGQAVAALVGFQTWQIVVRYGALHLKAGEDAAFARLVACSLGLDWAGAIAGCLIAAGAVWLVGPYLGWDAADSRAALAFAIILLLSVRSTAIGVLRAHDRYALGAAADAVTPLVRMAGAVVVVLAGATVGGFLLVWALSEAVTALVYWLIARRVGRAALRLPRKGDARWAMRENPGLWRFAAGVNAGAVLAGVSRQLVVLLIGMFVGPVAAGGYRLANQIGQALARAADLLSRALFGELARAHAGYAGTALPDLFRHATLVAAGLAGTIVLLLVTVGRPALGLIAGADYLWAYPLLLMLGIAAALDVAGVSFEPALLATGRVGRALTLRCLTAALLFAALAGLLPVWGVTGAALATLLASAAGLLLFGASARAAVRRQA